MSADSSAGGNPRETCLEMGRSAEQRLGIKVFAPEYEIVSVLFDISNISAMELQKHFSGSHTSFYKILGDLEARAILSAEPNPGDRRSKLYRLSDTAEQHLLGQWRSYLETGHGENHSVSVPDNRMYRYGEIFRARLRLRPPRTIAIFD